jgi:hypothetical protein
MKYFKHVETINGLKCTRYFQPEGTRMCIPEAADNTDFDNMMVGLNADPPTNTVEEVDDTE